MRRIRAMWPTASALASVAVDDASALDEPGEDALDGLVLGQATQPAEIWQFLPEAFRTLARARFDEGPSAVVGPVAEETVCSLGGLEFLRHLPQLRLRFAAAKDRFEDPAQADVWALLLGGGG